MQRSCFYYKGNVIDVRYQALQRLVKRYTS
jgi:hypothetical protein